MILQSVKLQNKKMQTGHLSEAALLGLNTTDSEITTMSKVVWQALMSALADVLWLCIVFLLEYEPGSILDEFLSADANFSTPMNEDW